MSARSRLLATISEYDDFYGLVLEIEAEAVRAALMALREAIETEWYNGNIDEDACDRLLLIAAAGGEET